MGYLATDGKKANGPRSYILISKERSFPRSDLALSIALRPRQPLISPATVAGRFAGHCNTNPYTAALNSTKEILYGHIDCFRFDTVDGAIMSSEWFHASRAAVDASKGKKPDLVAIKPAARWGEEIAKLFGAAEQHATVRP